MRINAQHLPNLKGIAPWNAILPADPPICALEEDQKADFTIVGAGFAGLSAARRLLQIQPSAKIVVLDAMSIAEGTAGRNSGFMIDLPHMLTSENYDQGDNSRTMTMFNRQAIEFSANTVEEYAINPDYFERRGKINGAVGAKAHDHNRSYAALLDQEEEPYEMLDKQQMQQITGSRYYRSGLYTPGTVLIQPAGYIRGFAKGLSRHIALFANSPAESIVREGKHWCIQTPGGKVQTEKIILANNGHIESFGYARGRLLQVFLYASMTVELDNGALAKIGGEPRWGITPSDPMGSTIRRIDTPLGGNRIITRTCASLRSDMQISEHDVARAGKIHQKKFDQRFPELAGMTMEYQWAGHLCISLNDVSLVQQLEEGIFSACVQNGLGTTRGTLTGIAAAELACGETSQMSTYFVDQEPPKPLVPLPFRDWGGSAYLSYQEWRARAE